MFRGIIRAKLSCFLVVIPITTTHTTATDLITIAIRVIRYLHHIWPILKSYSTYRPHIPLLIRTTKHLLLKICQTWIRTMMMLIDFQLLPHTINIHAQRTVFCILCRIRKLRHHNRSQHPYNHHHNQNLN